MKVAIKFNLFLTGFYEDLLIFFWRTRIRAKVWSNLKKKVIKKRSYVSCIARRLFARSGFVFWAPNIRPHWQLRRRLKRNFSKARRLCLYPLREVNFTISFVVHCSLWKVKHRICVTTSKNQTLRELIGKWNFQVFSFRFNTFPKNLKFWSSLF